LKFDNLLFVGFMGSGKSSVARYVAKALKRQFLDTDTMIESSEGRTIPEIFAQEGEPYFRACEKEVATWLAHDVHNTIVSTGGGFAIFQPICECGTILYLESSFEEIVARLNQNELSKRPLLQDMDQARALFEKRQGIYESVAHYRIDGSGSVTQASQRVLAFLESL